MPIGLKLSKGGNGTPATTTAGDPPKRTPTDSSYYDCHGVLNHADRPNARDWHYARDVRAQVQAERPPITMRKRGYPSRYGNYGNEIPDLSMPKPYTHVPITPGQSTPFKRRSQPGAHRAIYNNKDRTKVDVIYHDPKKPIPRGSNHRPFSKADYVPKASSAAAAHKPGMC